jgi:hypothetical protein
MIITRIKNTPAHHVTLILNNEGDPFELDIIRSKDNDRLQFIVEHYTHKFIVSLSKTEETELLSKLKFISD